jgi:response regulator RpfG family c-di-GMP phosphodiesterase
LRLLILEDDPTTSMILQGVIEDTVPSIVVVYTSLVSAEKVISQHFDLVLLDVRLLNGTSYDIAVALQRNGIAFCFVSATRPDDLPDELFGCPFIEKPFHEGEIREVIMNAKLEKERISKSIFKKPPAH